MKHAIALTLVFLVASCVTLGDRLLYIKNELAHEECVLSLYTTGTNPRQVITLNLEYGERFSIAGRLPLLGKANCPSSRIKKEILFTTTNDQKELVFQ